MNIMSPRDDVREFQNDIGEYLDEEIGPWNWKVDWEYDDTAHRLNLTITALPDRTETQMENLLDELTEIARNHVPVGVDCAWRWIRLVPTVQQ